VRSDVYSLGATAYMLIAAQPPFSFPPTASPADQLAIVASSQPTRLWDVAPHVPRSVQTAIERAMNRDPAARYAQVTDFAHALGARRERARSWRRTDEHPPHLGCWRGEPRGGGSTVVLCIEGGTQPSRINVTARHANSGNVLRRATRSAPLRNWGATVRSAMSAVDRR
jgi:serine/threonine protein kinase